MHFGHGEAIPGFDLEMAYKRYLDQALTAQDRREFVFATMEFLSQLRNGHTRVIDEWLNKTYGKPLGFRLVYLHGKWVVNRSSIAGVRRGDIIQSLDNADMEQYYQEKSKYIQGSSDRMARSTFWCFSFLFPQHFMITLAGGKQLTIDRTTHDPNLNTDEIVEGRWLVADEIAYIKIPAFNDPALEANAVKKVDRFKQARRIIIDVRGNGGGSTPIQLIMALMDRPFPSGMISAPINISARAVYDRMVVSKWVCRDQDTQPQEGAYHGQVIVLVDRDTASAAEDLVMPIKETHRGVIIGETTAGTDGMPFVHDFGDGMIVLIGAMRVFFSDGSQFEGVGITPNIVMDRKPEDLIEDIDRPLLKAQELALPT